MKTDILVFAAHPDDAELACSGTIMAHIALGYKVVIIDLTRGELGTRGTPQTRKEEADASSAIMGIHGRENLGFRDGFFVKDEAHILKVIEVIRKYQPSLVFANAVIDRHIDHGRAADLVHDACFLSGLTKIKTSINDSEQAAWRPKKVYHYIQDMITNPDIIVDITAFHDRKLECIKAFKTQFYNPDSTEPLTPISVPEFMDQLVGRSLEFGRRIGVTYAEGFTVKGNIGSTDLLNQL
ncbi:MAG: bacillithiol biosynthesis deacetylase BshB1 [Bacteroidetes bacterium B1(2017)]|nr:MAG: bacillithiol biosynthesis deacetylase BshB1 [Bacteroidetes bacterium B1(2017)]